MAASARSRRIVQAMLAARRVFVPPREAVTN
jgi:hypothetical protein